MLWRGGGDVAKWKINITTLNFINDFEVYQSWKVKTKQSQPSYVSNNLFWPNLALIKVKYIKSSQILSRVIEWLTPFSQYLYKWIVFTGMNIRHKRCPKHGASFWEEAFIIAFMCILFIFHHKPLIYYI